MRIFDPNALLQLGERRSAEYVGAAPFPHMVFDDFLDTDLLKEIVKNFPSASESEFYVYDNPLEKKLAFDRVAELPTRISQVLLQLNSPVFLRFLEKLTGIDGLIPDPYFRGGGIHEIPPKGKLDIHIDFNFYSHLRLYRRLNVLLYLNDNWTEEYGGHFELWSGRKSGEQHTLVRCEKKVLPIFNRLVVFSTSENSYHGHPEPLNCPPERSRKSIATYYYTSTPGQDASAAPHSTVFIRRPEDPVDPELDAMRLKRSQGRLQSNVQSDVTATD